MPGLRLRTSLRFLWRIRHTRTQRAVRKSLIVESSTLAKLSGDAPQSLMTRCSSWRTFIQSAIHVSSSTVLEAPNLVRNHVASDAVKPTGEEQFSNVPPSAPHDPLVTELAKAESALEKIEAQHIAAKARIAALRKELAAHEAPPRPVGRRCGAGLGSSALRGTAPWPPAAATRRSI
jgi:hypothetical protein